MSMEKEGLIEEYNNRLILGRRRQAIAACFEILSHAESFTTVEF